LKDLKENLFLGQGKRNTEIDASCLSSMMVNGVKIYEERKLTITMKNEYLSKVSFGI
jgi:hypothetical protein